MMSQKKFDLNIEKVLEHWAVAHAIREIIANALDEQALTNTDEPRIFKDNFNKWHIRDYGRGIRYEHFTQNENAEKMDHPNLVIGKFGVGLKDALATFYRNNVDVLIKSKYGDIGIAEVEKSGFSDIKTLHALISEPSDPNMIGTEVILGARDTDIEDAKHFFLRYGESVILESTPYGMVVSNPGESAIYANGLLIAHEENFLFSYNITSMTSSLRKALNRERTNVGRTAYSDRVKKILLECISGEVANPLTDDLQNFERGTLHDELQWNDVAVHACQILNAREKVIFVTPYDAAMSTDLLNHAVADGYRKIVVPDAVADKFSRVSDTDGAPIRDMSQYLQEWNSSFSFTFVDPKELTKDERKVFDLVQKILGLANLKPTVLKEILISETMRRNEFDGSEVLGLCEFGERRITIKRSQLKNVESFAGTLLHELAHAVSGHIDATREFETTLTSMLGVVSNNALKKKSRFFFG
jgi:hypothetical protein